jgi:prepilin peptidase CpaA
MDDLIQITFCAAWFGVLLAAAVACDVRTHRIPNSLVLSGIVAAFALHALLPGGASLFDAHSPGGLGILHSFAGLVIGIAVLLPLYLLRVMGAGDVKLMGMVGALLGPGGALSAALLTLVVGGVLAAGAALASGSMRRAISNARMILTSALLKTATVRSASSATAASAGKIPYAVAIASGALIHVVLSRDGSAL